MTQQTMTEREVFLQHFEREHQTTLKVLRAYPPNQLDFKPDPRSSSARDVIWMMVHIQKVDDLMKGKMEGQMPPAPRTLDELIASFESVQRELVKKVRALSEDQYHDTIRIRSGKDSSMDVRIADALWFTLMMLVHHRGQLSVYLRMAGGKVPSIYGPSADEPWN